MKPKLVIAIVVLGLAVTNYVFCEEDFPLHGRISYDANNTMIKGQDDADWSHATLNTLVLTGDTLWVDKGGSTEIEFPDGVFLRMADASKAVIIQISPELIFQGITGSFYIERISRSSGSVRFNTPACRITFDPDTCTRIDIGENGATRISTRWGKAYVTTDRGGNEVVSSGKRCWVDVGYLPSVVASFAMTEMDTFDRWNQGRSELLSGPVRTPPKYVEVTSRTIGYADLSDYGDWILIEERYYWRPTVVVNYVPYRVGYWTYVPAIGSVWIETYPFGYITTHYGRWVYFETYGWVWGFDPVWSPAWVATVRCGDYFVWTPVDFYCRPVRVSTSVSFVVGGVNFYVGACSYVPATYVYTSPWYVAPVPTTVVNYIVTNPTNIYVWNIERCPVPRVRVPYETSIPLVRDYNPPRTIRGVPYYNDSGMLARARVEELENYFTRRTSNQGFRSVGDMPSSSIRTAMLNDRATSFREVRLNTTSPKPADVRFSPDNFLQRSSGVERGSIRGKELDTGFTRAVERNINSIRDTAGSTIGRMDVRNSFEHSSTSGNIRDNITLNRQVRYSMPDMSDKVGRSGSINRKEFETPALSRLDMDGERRPRGYDSSGSGSTISPPRSTPRNDSGSGTTNRDRNNTTPRSTTPTDRNNPGNRSNPRGSSLNWDNINRTPSDLRSINTVREMPQRTSIAETPVHSAVSRRSNDNFTVNPFRQMDTPTSSIRTSIPDSNRFSIRSLPAQNNSTSINSERSIVREIPRNNNSSTSFNIPSLGRSNFSDSIRVSPNPVTSRPATIDTPRVERQSIPSAFSVPKVETPSFSTPSVPSFHRSSPNFSGGRQSIGHRGIR